MTEAGVRDFNVSAWWGLVGLPADVQIKLNATGKALVKRFTEEGCRALPRQPGRLRKVLRSELETWQKVVKDGALKVA